MKRILSALVTLLFFLCMAGGVWGQDCIYISGDINGDGDATPLADLMYGACYFRGGPPPGISCDCQPNWPGADANGTCSFNGIDLTYLTQYWTGEVDSLLYCSGCPAPQPDTSLPVSGIDPEMPDTIVIGTLDLMSIRTYPGDTLSIPIWVKNDEAVAGVNIPLAGDNEHLVEWMEGTKLSFLAEWQYCGFREPELDNPGPGYTTQSLLGWWIGSHDGPLMNSHGAYCLIGAFSVIISSDFALVGDTVQIISGNYARAGGVAFCDSVGQTEWSPAMVIRPIIIVESPPDIDLSSSALVDTVNEGFSVSQELNVSNLGEADLWFAITGDSSWITAMPDSGYLRQAESDSALISFDAAYLMHGTYSGSISITSNDPDEGLLTLPVTLVVLEAPFGAIEGTVTDEWDLPVTRAFIGIDSLGVVDTTNNEGRYHLGPLASQSYDIRFAQPRFADTIISNVEVPPYDTAIVDMVMRALPPGLIRVPEEYSTIQSGMEIAHNEDTVLVAPGVYNENVSFLGKEITLKSRGGPDSTILEPDSSDLPIVTFSRHENPLSILEGFTIRSSVNISAIVVDSAAATIRGNIIADNGAPVKGGGVCAFGGGAIDLIDNVFMNNSALEGGAVSADETMIYASGNQFIGNTSTWSGAAVSQTNARNFEIHHNLFCENHAGSQGSALRTLQCNDGGLIYNNTVAFNICHDTTDYGGTILLQASDFIYLYNNVVVQNIGYGVNAFASNLTNIAVYNDVWENTFDYADIFPGEGSISVDPLFAGGDPYSYELTASSPCIDTGDPSSPLDPDSTRADMGAFCFDHQASFCPYVIGDINGSGTTNGLDVTYGVAFFKGGPPPPISCGMCPEPAPFYAGGDVNGSCSFNGLDITYMVVYFKGGPLLQSCPDCPPAGR
jgi:hypothetical protein